MLDVGHYIKRQYFVIFWSMLVFSTICHTYSLSHQTAHAPMVNFTFSFSSSLLTALCFWKHPGEWLPCPYIHTGYTAGWGACPRRGR